MGRLVTETAECHGGRKSSNARCFADAGLDNGIDSRAAWIRERIRGSLRVQKFGNEYDGEQIE